MGTFIVIFSSGGADGARILRGDIVKATAEFSYIPSATIVKLVGVQIAGLVLPSANWPVPPSQTVPSG